MPAYSIECKACKDIEEVWMTWKERDELLKKPCPQCGKIQRVSLIKGVSFQMSRQFRNGLA